ncbi:MAG: IPT/TIG domain-containing protein, partial [Candidatus Coatesbacteria bacterium]
MGAYTYTAAPTITSLGTTCGPVAGGTTGVVINGTNLTGVTAVTIGGAAATVTGNTATTVTVTTPAGTAGAQDVVVTTCGGSVTSVGAFTYAAVPTITTLDTTSGPVAGGTTGVVINGTNLTGVTAVTIGGAAATVTGNTATTVTVTTPAGTAGAQDVVVTTCGGAATLVGGFTYIAAGDAWDPGDDVSSTGTVITPTLVTQAHGPHTITTTTDCADWYRIDMIAGRSYHFDTVGGAGDDAAWLYSDAAGTVQVAADDDSGGIGQFSFDYVAASTQTYYLKVAYWNPCVGGWSGSLNYYYSIPPAGDAWDPGDDVSTTGTVLTPTASTQAHGPHVLNVTDTADWYQIAMTAGTSYHFDTVGGSGDSRGRLYSDSAGTLQVASDDDSGGSWQFTFDYVAASTQTYYLKVDGFGGDWSGSLNYSYCPGAPTITTLDTTSGPVAGGTTGVVINGTNLTGVTAVTIGGAAATVTGNTATTVTVTTPAGTAGARDVVVTTCGGPVTLVGGFTYVAGGGPTLAAAAASASVLSVGGTGTVTLTVTNTGGADATGVIPELLAQGAGVTVTTGPTPAGPVTIGAGGNQTFSWTWSVSGMGWVSFTASAGGAAAVAGTPVYPQAAPACVPAVAWSRSWGGPWNEGEQAEGVVVDQAGNVYAAGMVSVGAGNVDWSVVKLDPAGNLLWNDVRAGVGSGEDRAACIVLEPAGTVLVGGKEQSSCCTVGMIRRYTSAGALVWSASIYAGSLGFSQGFNLDKIARDAQGNLLVAAHAEAGAGNSEWILQKYDANWTLLWTRTHGGNAGAEDLIGSIVVDGAGNIIVDGTEINLVGGKDWRIIKYDPAGTVIWSVGLNGSAGGDDEAWGLAAGPAGDVIVGGYQTGPTGAEALIRKYDASGGLVWSRTDGGSGAGFSAFLPAAADADGNVVASAADFDGSAWRWVTVRFGPAGDVQWTAALTPGPGAPNVPFAMALDAAGRPVVAGMVDAGGGASDWRIVRYGACGPVCPGAPTITSLGTTCGPVAGGTTGVVINGTNLAGTSAVTIGGAAATVTGNTATTVTVTTPAGTAGAQDVVVTTCGGPVTSVGAFTYAAVPTITTLGTTCGPVAGGTTGVVINGTDLAGASAVTIGGAAATVTGNTATTVTVTTPAGTAGAQDVVVTTCGGVATSVGAFTYSSAIPTITTLGTTCGPTAGGTAGVVINGTNLAGASAVTIGGAAATITGTTATTVTVTTPAGTAGAQDVVVTGCGGVATSVGAFTYTAAPTIASLGTTCGPTAGGTTGVVINGTNLTGVTAVTIGGAAATLESGTTMISTVAGTGTGGYNGDSIAATLAQLNGPAGVAVDGSGNIYVAELFGNRVRKVTALTGQISTVAGTGVGSYNGDNIAATSAQINTPRFVTVDAAGNLYIGDTGNHRVRKVTAATGLISTVAGTGVAGYNSDAISATVAQLSSPFAASVDGAGNLYIADFGNFRIRKVTAATGQISTVAGTGAKGFNSDGIAATAAQVGNVTYVAVDGSGNLYIADNSNYRIRKVTFSTGQISTVAGTGVGSYNGDGIAATSANLDNPGCVIVDGAGNLYITDNGPSHRLRKVTYSTGNISTLAGTGVAGYNGDGIPATTARLQNPFGVALDGSGNLYVGDALNNRVRELTVPAGLIVTTPAGTAGAQDVAVTTCGGTATLVGGFVYSAGAPTITTLGTTCGPVAGGTTGVVINGTNLAGASAVTIGGAAATITGNSTTTVTVTTPAGTAGARDVVVTTCTGVATSVGGFTYTAAPTITSLGTTCGPVAGGTTGVVINGTNLATVTAVTIGGAAATVTGNTATTVTVTTPAGTAGAQDVVVTTCGGPVTSVGAFTYTAAPTITTLDTTSGPVAGGTTGVVINGTNLSGVTAVTIGGAAATVTGNTATTVTVTTPAGTAGAQDVAVTTCASVGSATLVGGFTYVTSVTDAWDPGDDASTTGTVLTPTTSTQAHGPHTLDTGDCADWYRIDMTAGWTYHFDTVGGTGDSMGYIYSDAAGTVLMVSDDDSGGSAQFSITWAAASTQTYYLKVVTFGGCNTWSGSLNYSYCPGAPTIASLGTTCGPVAGGTTGVVITGTNLTGVTAVTIGGAAATVTGNTATTVTVTTPAGTAGAQDVVVTTCGGPVTSVGAYTYTAAPTITSLGTTCGPVAGGTTGVVINGTNLAGASAVTIGGAAATVTGNTATTVTVTTPAGTAGAQDVVVTTCGGVATSVGAYTYTAAPTITSLGTTCGPVVGGTTGVVINGTNLTGVTAVTIGGAAATVTGNTATTVTVTTPAGTAGAQDVVVTTCGGPVTSVGAYTYTAAPTITSLGTTCGPVAGGTTGVVINGTNLTGVTAVTIGGAAATVTGNTATTVTVTTPAGTAGAQDVVVTTCGGAVTSVGAFTYTAAPTITTLGTTCGPVAGGTTGVVITGTNLTGVTAVTIGGAAAT